MSSVEQLETLRNAELYDDCKTLVMIFVLFLSSKFNRLIFFLLGGISFNFGRMWKRISNS